MAQISRRDCSHSFACWLVIFTAVVPGCVLAQQPYSMVSYQFLDSGENDIDTRRTAASSEKPENNKEATILDPKFKSEQARIEQNQKVLDHLYNKVKHYDSGIFNYEKKIN